MNTLTVIEELNKAEERIKGVPERILARGLDQPCNPSISGSRKLLADSQQAQAVPINNPEIPIMGTGYDIRFGDLSSSIIKALGDYSILKIVDKYSFRPKYHYWAIMYDMDNHIYRLLEVKHFKYISEKHGFTYNTEFMDALTEGDIIPAGSDIRKSSSFDEYNNRTDGCNLLCICLATEKNTEDSIILSEDIREKMSTTHYRNKRFIINHNCRLQNRYGQEGGEWKGFPDVGEEVKEGIFCSIREANKEEELYTLSYNRLKEYLSSDDTTIMPGRVVGIDVYSNDPSALDTFYNVQLKKYYNEGIRVAQEVVSTIDEILAKNPNAILEDKLKEFVYLQRRVLAGTHFFNDGREFSNVCIEVTVEEKALLSIGDKLADRYGGKGVISFFLPKDKMPKTLDGQTIDMIQNQATCVNRLNPSLLKEPEVNYISGHIVRYIEENKLDNEEALELILKFYKIISPLQYQEFSKYTDRLMAKDPDLVRSYINSIIEDGYIYVSLRPIQDNITVDLLEELYNAFPFIDQEYLNIPLMDSNGNIRWILSRRKCVCSRKFMRRLKQYSEEKFSATSLSATNIKNLNAKSKAFKKYKAFHSNTPIAMGNMESDELVSLGQELVISNLMLNSVSPHGRLLMKEALIGDPMTLDIKLDDEAANRNVQILNAYQKAKGVALEFLKYRRQVRPLVFRAPENADELLVRRSKESKESINEINKKIHEMNNRETTNLVQRSLVSRK